MDKYSLAESYLHPHEAQIAKSSLLNEGIRAIIENEHTIGMNWFYSQAIGGVKVLVPVEDLVKAQEILRTDYSTCLDANLGTDPDSCTNCGSTNIKPYTKGRAGAFLTILLFGIPLLFYKNGYKCDDCESFAET